MASMSTPLGEQIRQARLQRGWSQTRLGTELGTSKKTVGMWERGNPISPLRLAKLAALLELDTSGLWVQTGRRYQHLEFSAPEPEAPAPVPHRISYSMKLPAAALEPETALATLKRLRKELARISVELDQAIERLE